MKTTPKSLWNRINWKNRAIEALRAGEMDLMEQVVIYLQKDADHWLGCWGDMDAHLDCIAVLNDADKLAAFTAQVRKVAKLA